MGIARIAALSALCLLAACGEPVPLAKAAYVGDWQAPHMWLSISADGHVSYARQNGNLRTNINAPIQAFEGDDFIVGFLWFRTRFVVSKPPHQEKGAWRMTVDGVDLTRSRSATDWVTLAPRTDRGSRAAQG